MRKTVFSLGLLLAGQASAFTPESGFYWNPAEGGRGFSIEIQDNYLFLAAYVYSQTGTPIWFTAQGTLNVTSQSNDFASYVGVLDSFSNGQCITCTYRVPMTQAGSGGNFRVDFTSETRATITWAGGTVPIQRFDFFLTPPGGKARTDGMLGQWQTVIDLATTTSGNQENLLYAEALNFDRRSADSVEDYFDGCSVYSSGQRACTQADINVFGASGFHFSENQAGVIKDRLLIAVPYSSSQFVIYYLDYGTYQFNGLAKFCPNSMPASQRFQNCILSNNFRAYPARGMRTASRSYIAGNNAAPNAISDPKRAEGTPRVLPVRSVDSSAGMDQQTALEQTGLDFNDIPQAAFEALMQRVDAR